MTITEPLFKNASEKIFFFVTLAIIIAISAFVFLYEAPEIPVIQEDTRLRIATTVVPVEILAKEIGGDKVQVELIVPEGQSPHTFEPTPDAIKRISRTEKVFTLGIIDEWISPLAETLGIPTFYIGSGVYLRPVAEVFTIGEKKHSSDEGQEYKKEKEYDPHYWLSISNGKIMATNIAQELSRLDPPNRELYQANLASFISRASAADIQIREILAGIENRNIITFHDAWGYFAADYGLEVVAVYQPSPGKEPSPRDIRLLLDTARKYGIKTFFSEVMMPTAPFEAIGEGEGIKVIPLNPLETRGNYLETLIWNAKTIRDAKR